MKHDPANMAALAKALHMDPSALTEILAETGIKLVTDTSVAAAKKKAKAEARAIVTEILRRD